MSYFQKNYSFMKQFESSSFQRSITLVSNCNLLIKTHKTTNFRDILGGGGPQNFGPVCCSMGPQQLMFYFIFKKEFSAVLFYGTQFISKKSVKKSIHFWNFFSKNQCLTLQNGYKWKDFVEF